MKMDSFKVKVLGELKPIQIFYTEICDTKVYNWAILKTVGNRYTIDTRERLLYDKVNKSVAKFSSTIEEEIALNCRAILIERA